MGVGGWEMSMRREGWGRRNKVKEANISAVTFCSCYIYKRLCCKSRSSAYVYYAGAHEKQMSITD